MSFVPVFLLISLLNNSVVNTLFVILIFKFKVNLAILVHSDASIGEIAFRCISSDTRWLVFLLILGFVLVTQVYSEQAITLPSYCSSWAWVKGQWVKG